MKKAFNYMFFDNLFFKKVITFLAYVFLLVYCSNFSLTGCKGTILVNFFNAIILMLILLLGYSIVEGYKIAIIKSINVEQNYYAILPIFNIKKDLKIGIKYLISFLIFSTPIFCIIGAFGFIVGFAPMLNMPNFLSNTSCILLFLSIFAYTLYLICFLPACIVIFTKTNSIWSFYKFEEIFKLISLNKKEYIKSALIFFILSIVIEECYKLSLNLNNQSIMLFTIMLFLMSVIITYLSFVVCYMVARIKQ